MPITINNSLFHLLLVLVAVPLPTDSKLVDKHEVPSPSSLLTMMTNTYSPLPPILDSSTLLIGQEDQRSIRDDDDDRDEPHASETKRQTAASVGFFDEDPEARAGFQQKVGRVVKEMMEEEIRKFVDNMSETAMGHLTDQLLSFTLVGQRYLCLNIVCPSINGSRPYW